MLDVRRADPGMRSGAGPAGDLGGDNEAPWPVMRINLLQRRLQRRRRAGGRIHRPRP